ncbi:GSCOCG00009824001-RA-CDS, partial [Cotesia congregata]
MSFIIDGWTSIANRSFYGITIHFIDNDWKYQSMVLDFVASHGKHTGKDIAQVFYKCIKEFELEGKIQGITVDNASANTKFMIELQNLLPNFDAENQHFRCMAHVLNLGVQDLMKTLSLNTYNDNGNNSDE